MELYAQDYLGHLIAERGASPATVRAYQRDLEDYLGFLQQDRRIAEVGAVRKDDVDAFVAALRTRGLAPSTVERRMSVVKGYHRFLLREGLAASDPA